MFFNPYIHLHPIFNQYSKIYVNKIKNVWFYFTFGLKGLTMIQSAQRSIQVSAAQHHQLHVEGFFITEVLFDEQTLEEVRGEFERLNAGMDPNKAGGVFASALHSQSEICREFLRHPIFAELCRQLIGPNVFQTWNQMIYKRPLNSQSFGWHQDGYYATHHPDGSPGLQDPSQITLSGAITFWVAITPATVENGCLWVLPKSHRGGLLPHHYNEAKKEWVGDYDTFGAVPAELEPGQIFVFTGLTPHSSGANRTDEPRIGYQIGYRDDLGVRDCVPFLKNGQVV